jgi:hypothetical protein
MISIKLEIRGILMKKRRIYVVCLLVVIAGASLFYLKKEEILIGTTVTNEEISTKVDITAQEIDGIPFTITSYNLGDTICGVDSADIQPFYVNNQYLMANAGYFTGDMGNTKSSFDEDIYYIINMQTKMCEMKVRTTDSSPEIGVSNGFIRREEKRKSDKLEESFTIFDIHTKKEAILASEKDSLGSIIYGKGRKIIWTEDDNKKSQLVTYDIEKGMKEILYETEGERTYTSHTGTTISQPMQTEVGIMFHKHVTKESGVEEAFISLLKEAGQVIDYPNTSKAYSVALNDEWIVYANEVSGGTGQRKIEVHRLVDGKKMYEFPSGANTADIYIQGDYLFIWEDMNVYAVHLPIGKKTAISSGEASKVQKMEDVLTFTETKDGEEIFNVIRFK